MSIYTDLTEALAFVKELTSISDRDVILSQKLKVSAGKLKADTAIEGVTVASGTIIYRSYYVSAKALQQNRRDVSIKQADGVTFSGLVGMIDSLMDEQLAIDLALDLDVPNGFMATTDLDGSMNATSGSPVMSVIAG
ncbi:MAG: hypothetical protein KME13_21670 [Myxacorys californica WJT36-NPBG1]|jgi:hypothetical protein|nr:hypothetical protein [Myxacorys californica WJT36-NPBG1]